jgi:hypothetical protein
MARRRHPVQGARLQSTPAPVRAVGPIAPPGQPAPPEGVRSQAEPLLGHTPSSLRLRRLDVRVKTLLITKARILSS